MTRRSYYKPTGQNHEVRTILTFISLTLLLLAPAVAQYSIDWHKISGGGGTSTGGVYSVSGTIGQHDATANNALTGGSYSVTGGFWSLYAMQTPGAPLLSIRLTSTNTAMVFWPSPSTGFNLQMNTNVATTNWSSVAESIQDNGAIKFIIVTPPAGNRYFRLKSP